MDSNIIFTIATWLIPLTIAIVFHEVAHGWVAQANGDQTAARLGRLSLNPIKHIDPIGTVALPTFLAVIGAPIFGWAKPVPVMQSQLNNPRWDMVKVAAAGPATNIVLGIIGAVLLGLAIAVFGPVEKMSVGGFILTNLQNFIVINIFLALFNMIPIPPFDGSKVLGGFLPPSLGIPFQNLERFGFLFLIILIVVVPRVTGVNIVAEIVMPPFQWVMGWLGSIVTAIAGG